MFPHPSDWRRLKTRIDYLNRQRCLPFGHGAYDEIIRSAVRMVHMYACAGCVIALEGELGNMAEQFADKLRRSGGRVWRGRVDDRFKDPAMSTLSLKLWNATWIGLRSSDPSSEPSNGVQEVRVSEIETIASLASSIVRLGPPSVVKIISPNDYQPHKWNPHLVGGLQDIMDFPVIFADGRLWFHCPSLTAQMAVKLKDAMHGTDEPGCPMS